MFKPLGTVYRISGKFSAPLSSNDFALNDFAFSLRLPSFAPLRLNSL